MSNPLALIIEDDQKLAVIFTQALRQAGYETETIYDGRTALERLAVITPVVIVLDLHLPQASGKDILRQIRQEARLVDTRVMLATADALMADTLRSEVELILLKPISFTQLRDLAIRLRPPDTVDIVAKN